MSDTRPILMLDEWIKQATDLERPAGVGDIKRGQSSVGKDRQQYANPTPPVAATRTDMISSQKAMSPPPL